MHRLTLTLTLAVLPVTRGFARHPAAPGDTDTGPVIRGHTCST